MSKGIFAFYGITDQTTVAAVDSLTRAFRMPFVTTSVPIHDPRNCLPSSSALQSSASMSSAAHSSFPYPHQHSQRPSLLPLQPPLIHLHQQQPPSISSSSSSSSFSASSSASQFIGTAADRADGAPDGGSGRGSGGTVMTDTAPGTGGYLLYLRPFYDRPILSVIQYYRWKRIFYFYDTDAGQLSRKL
jgi:hypothetical protein